MATLTSIARYKASQGDLDVPGPKDDQINFALSAASELIRAFTGLKFEVASSGSLSDTRTYEYDGGSYLDIDEATLITGVSMRSGYDINATPTTLDTYAWGAFPLNSPVKLWLRLPAGNHGTISPEMGFRYNLDTIGFDVYQNIPAFVNVTATWGWPTIPEDVQQATIWTAQAIAMATSPYQQESIESYSHTKGPMTDMESIPLRAQAALMPYIIPRV